jgi:futalosine hydrolase
MKATLLYVTATEAEASAIRIAAKQPDGKNLFAFGNFRVSLLVTGIGMVPVAWNMSRWIAVNGKPDLAINGGIAGSFRNDILNGTVVIPSSDCFADSGIEDNDRFMTLAEAGLNDPNEFPFNDGIIPADSTFLDKFSGIRKVRAITSGTSSGSHATIRRLVEKYNPDIESMEGASFFYICKRESIPFFALRAISNFIEPRKRENWNIGLALRNLSAKLEESLLNFD